MYHSITFGNKNTWDDWHLVPSSRPVFNPPDLKQKTLEIPGGDGFIDLSESLTGYPVYENREGSLEFIVMNDYWEWQEAYSTILDYIHGRKMKAVLEDDPNYYYEGRFTVNEWRSEEKYSTITIDYSLAPYKTKIEESSNTIQMTTSLQAFGLSYYFYGHAPVCPTFVINASAGATIRFINNTLGIDLTKTVSGGTVQIPEFVCYGDSVLINLTGKANGTMIIKCKYRRL